MKDKKSLERWHGAHHYSDKIHLLLIFFLIFTTICIGFAYFELNNPKLYFKNAILSPSKTLEQISPTPKLTCTPRPSCLDTEPRCLIAETEDMCPPQTPTPTIRNGDPVFCTQEAKLCPDGSYVGRVGPKCEFSLCP